VHPTLIKANLALFRGSRAETRRLLADYLAETRTNAIEQPMVLWLDANAQSANDERLRRLQTLVAAAGRDDTYGRMAAAALDTEAALMDEAAPRRPRLPLLAAGAFGLLALVALVFLLRPAPPPALPAVEADTGVVVMPDRSVALERGSYAAETPQGLLQIIAVEDNSERVVDVEGRALLQPVAGARFFALELIFECRAGICRTPPEADLNVRLDGDILIEARAGVGVAGERLMQPVAQGRSTGGWVVFEIPVSALVTSLEITPAGDDEATPLVIDLRAL
jgi:hypothetical protein